MDRPELVELLEALVAEIGGRPASACGGWEGSILGHSLGQEGYGGDDEGWGVCVHVPAPARPKQALRGGRCGLRPDICAGRSAECLAARLAPAQLPACIVYTSTRNRRHCSQSVLQCLAARADQPHPSRPPPPPIPLSPTPNRYTHQWPRSRRQGGRAGESRADPRRRSRQLPPPQQQPRHLCPCAPSAVLVVLRPPGGWAPRVASAQRQRRRRGGQSCWQSARRCGQQRSAGLPGLGFGPAGRQGSGRWRPCWKGGAGQSGRGRWRCWRACGWACQTRKIMRQSQRLRGGQEAARREG